MDAMNTGSPENAWASVVLRARIKHFDRRMRHEAGSPDPVEVARYRHFLHALKPSPQGKRVLVLGMTPEIRQMALEQGCQLTSIDSSAAAIELYTDWVTPALMEREDIFLGDWFAIDQITPHKADAILGDGIFGNILTIDGHHRLLGKLKEALMPGGVIIMRQALIPHGFKAFHYEAETLLGRYREGSLSESEFGFAMRLWGSYESAYDASTLLLDNRIVFERYQLWAAQSILTAKEHEIINRYYFGGMNMLLPQQVWESCLTEAGLHFQTEPLCGKAWYPYYPLYSCRVHGS